MADEDPVLLEVKGGVAVISLNRPDKHNVVDDAADALFFRYLDLLRSGRDVRAHRRPPARRGAAHP
jgi:enoyl-CoA hydratase/carnithine racemase